MRDGPADSSAQSSSAVQRKDRGVLRTKFNKEIHEKKLNYKSTVEQKRPKVDKFRITSSARRESPIPDETRPPQPKSGLSFVGDDTYTNGSVVGRSSVPIRISKSFLSNSIEVFGDYPRKQYNKILTNVNSPDKR